MKKFLVLFFSIFICSIAHADTETINWYVDGNSYATTTCQTGGDIILPNTPYKYGYTFQGWNTYTPIEYLETNNSSFINTNFIPLTTVDLYIKMSFKITYFTGNEVDGIFGYMNSNQTSIPRFSFFYYQPYNHFGTGLNNTDFWNENVSLGVKYTAELNNGTFTITDGTYLSSKPIATSTTGQTTYPICVGARCDENQYPRWPSNIKIYSFELRQGNTHIDLIPVLDWQNIPCMYDKVSKTFFYNQGTGNFIAGPVINQ